MKLWQTRERAIGALLAWLLLGSAGAGVAMYRSAFPLSTPGTAPTPLAIGWVVSAATRTSTVPDAAPTPPQAPPAHAETSTRTEPLPTPSPITKQPPHRTQAPARDAEPARHPIPKKTPAPKQKPKLTPKSPPQPRSTASPSAPQSRPSAPVAAQDTATVDRFATALASPKAPLAPLANASARPAAPEPSSIELKVLCHHRPPPSYPFIARRMGIEGTVTVKVTLDTRGTIVAAEADPSRSTTRHPALISAALTAVRQWRCTLPTAWHVGTVTVWQPFRFQLTASP